MSWRRAAAGMGAREGACTEDDDMASYEQPSSIEAHVVVILGAG